MGTWKYNLGWAFCAAAALSYSYANGDEVFSMLALLFLIIGAALMKNALQKK